MDDIDGMLATLARAPVPAGLDGLEGRVLDRLAAASTSRGGIGIGVFAVVGALALGMAGAAVPAASAAATSASSPFDPGLPLAPSTLLAGTP